MPSKEFFNRPGSIWERYDVPNHSIEEARREMDEIVVSELRCYEDVRWESGTCGALSGKWAYAADPSGYVLYYIHGGGFTHGSSGIAMPFILELCHRLSLNAFSADYRLAPEYTFPAAPEDARKGYQGLLDLGYAPDHIIVCGESAGATLTLDMPYLAREAGLEAPLALIALSPVTDATAALNETVLEGLSNPNEIYDIYAPGHDISDPLISPALGDLAGFPPVFLSVGTTEPLLQDALIFTKNASLAGCDVRLHVGREMIHTYPLDLWDYPEAMEAFEEIGLFIRQRIS